MTSYWLEEASEPLVPGGDDRVDVAVVGGGVTGCSCALTLAADGKRVRVYDAREVASGASGRNGGIASRGGAMGYAEAVEVHGRDAARELWAVSERYVDRLEAIAGDGFRRTGVVRLATDAEERDALLRDHEELVADGFASTLCDEVAERARAAYPVQAAALSPGDGALVPARWVRRLAARAAAAGAEFKERTRVERLEDLPAEVVVLATDGYTHGLAPELDAVVSPLRNQVVVTEPLEPLFACPHGARHGYDYWQQLPDGRLVFGGRRDADPENEATAEEALTPAIQAELERAVEALAGRPVEITHRWAGIFGATSDALPVAGELRAGVWAAAGYSGHGNVLGLACGDLVGRAILGDRHDLLDLFAPARF
jgi:glycine/D-amino acid oxidase-like deaminating enzyme